MDEFETKYYMLKSSETPFGIFLYDDFMHIGPTPLDCDLKYTMHNNFFVVDDTLMEETTKDSQYEFACNMYGIINPIGKTRLTILSKRTLEDQIDTLYNTMSSTFMIWETPTKQSQHTTISHMKNIIYEKQNE